MSVQFVGKPEFRKRRGKLFGAAGPREIVQHGTPEVIKKAKTHDEMVQLIDEGLKPYVRKLRRDVTREEILKLAEIPGAPHQPF